MYYTFTEKKTYTIDGTPHKVYEVASYNDAEKTDFVGTTALIAAGAQVDKPEEVMADADVDRTNASSPNYVVKRKEAYPNLEEQLDMQYHDAINGTTTWKDSIAKVKSDIPKG